MSVVAGELVTEEEVEDLVSTLTVFKPQQQSQSTCIYYAKNLEVQDHLLQKHVMQYLDIVLNFSLISMMHNMSTKIKRL